MLIYPIYKAAKTALAPLATGTFFYLKQYEKSKDNTSYKVPALYIEMPLNAPMQYYGKQLISCKNLSIKVHYISHAPFKNHTNSIQDTALQNHANMLQQIDTLLNGLVLKDANNKILTEQLLLINVSELRFLQGCVVSVLSYTCEGYAKHLQ